MTADESFQSAIIVRRSEANYPMLSVTLSENPNTHSVNVKTSAVAMSADKLMIG